MARFPLLLFLTGLLLLSVADARPQGPRIGVFADPEARFDNVCIRDFEVVDFYVVAQGVEEGILGYEFTIDLSELEAAGFSLINEQILVGTQDFPSNGRFVVTLDECVRGSTVPLVRFAGLFTGEGAGSVESYVCLAGIETGGVVGPPKYLDCAGTVRDFDLAGSFAGCLLATEEGACCPSDAREFTVPETVASPGERTVTVPVQLDRVHAVFRAPDRVLCEIYGYYGFRSTIAVDPLQLALVDVRMTAAVPEGWVLQRTDLAPGLIEIEITDPRVHGSEESRQLVDPDGAPILELDFELIQPGISTVELRNTDLCWLELHLGSDQECSYGYEAPVTLSTTVQRAVSVSEESFGTLKARFGN